MGRSRRKRQNSTSESSEPSDFENSTCSKKCKRRKRTSRRNKGQLRCKANKVLGSEQFSEFSTSSWVTEKINDNRTSSLPTCAVINKTSSEYGRECNDSSCEKQQLHLPVTSCNYGTPQLVTGKNDTSMISNSRESNVNFWAQNNFPVSFSVVPEYDPSDNSQTIESWINKVNECAQIYCWNDRQICHYALPKLSGLAKKWYQGLPSVLFSWSEWVQKLKLSFPSNENYGDLLTSMLKVRCKFGQPLENYFYDKMALLNKCEISGAKAVGCLVHGIDDKFIRMGAGACMFSEPEQLLNYLRTVSQNENNNSTQNHRGFKGNKFVNKSTDAQRTSADGSSQIRCFNCNELGHISLKCNKPIKRCNLCFKLGHDTKDCRKRSQLNNSENDKLPENHKNVLCVRDENTDNDKFYKSVKVNGKEKQAYIDLGSRCTLVRETDAKEVLGEWDICDTTVLQGFGNSTVKPLGRGLALIEIGDVRAEIDILVVPDQYLQTDLLIGHTFTEQPNVIMLKTNDELIFVQSPDCVDEEIKLKLYVDNECTVAAHCTQSVNVRTEDEYSGGLYIQYSHRNGLDRDYIILPGIYNFECGKGYIMLSNVSDSDMKLTGDMLITRGHKYTEINTEYVGITKETNTNRYDPLPLNEVKVGIELDSEQRERFYALLEKYRDCFAMNLSELGETNLTEMHINLTDNVPVVHNPYRMSQSEKEQLSVIIEDLLSNDIIRESNSSYSSPVILVKKKNGEKRLCVDYRALNRKTLKDKYPLPRIEDQLDSLGGNSLFTSLDLASGYYQVPMSEESKHLTAFVTPDGLFEYNRMPFGLSNAPSVFQRTINLMLRGFGRKLALAYMDDLLVASRDVTEGLEKLEKVFQLIRSAKLTLNLKKCSFFQTNVNYLGYEISSEGIRPGLCKIQAVEKFPRPKNVHEVRQFIGLTSYFRRFIENFSIIARPLTALTKKDAVWVFGDDQINAFNELKKKLTSRPVLALYDPNAELEIHTDASKLGIGAILMQRDNKDKLHPIAYYSRQTTMDESKFHSYELETLAVVEALERFRVYVLGKAFKVVTDCAAIRSTMTKRDLLHRVARWYLIMQEYDLTVEHRDGAKMAHVDALSRNPVETPVTHERMDVFEILRVEDDVWLQTVQEQDSELQRIKSILSDPATKGVVEIHKNYAIKNGRLYRIVEKNGEINLKWVVPKSVRWQIVRMNHDDAGHLGFDKTYEKISHVYWFQKMRRFIKKYCQSCLNCAHSKTPAGPKEGFLHPIPKVNKPFDTLHTDHCGPFPQSRKKNCHLLCIIDAFTKFIYIKPVKNLKSSTTIQVFNEYFALFGVPRRLISDRGTSFTSKEFEDYLNERGVKHILNAVAMPRANGQIERYNRTIVDALTAANHDKPENQWDLALPQIQWSLNNTFNKTTGRTPAEVLFGLRPTGLSDSFLNPIVAEVHNEQLDVEEVRDEVSNKILDSQARQKIRFDRVRKNPKVYSIGDLVRVERETRADPGNSRKLLPKCSGPYRITKVLGNDRYEVEDTPITKKKGSKTYRGTYSVDKLHPWLAFNNDVISSDSESS